MNEGLSSFPTEDINQLLLRVMGAFAHLQLMITEILAKSFFEKRVPKAAKFLLRRVVRRISDDERTDLVHVIAAEMDSPAELGDFTRIYNEVKDLRDKVSHAARIQVEGPDLLRVTRTYLAGNLGGVTVERTELDEAWRKCQWLEAQLFYILQSTGLTKNVKIGGAPVEYRKPPRLYYDWDGNAVKDADS